MSLRWFRECVLMVCMLLGTFVGYSAGSDQTPQLQMVYAFLGMGLAGGLAESCMRR
jgi:hypothetical protein